MCSTSPKSTTFREFEGSGETEGLAKLYQPMNTLTTPGTCWLTFERSLGYSLAWGDTFVTHKCWGLRALIVVILLSPV